MSDNPSTELALSTDVEKWERAYDLVILQGKSYNAASKELGCSHPTAKAWVERYREVLKLSRVSDKAEQTVELESHIMRQLARADSVYQANAGKGLIQVGAINASKALLEMLMRVRGLEAPKEDKSKIEGRITIAWGDPDAEPIEVEGTVR